MSESHATQIHAHDDWQMPLSLEPYDRSPTLTGAEREALAEVMALPRIRGRPLILPNHLSNQILVRLTRPLQDVYDLNPSHSKSRLPFIYRMYGQMLKLNKPFWGWSKEEWLKAISDIDRRAHHGIRISMRVTAYLLCHLLIIEDHSFPRHLARIVFGATKVAEQYERLATIIFGSNGFGYLRNRTQEQQLQAVLVLAMLVNRNPSLDEFTAEGLLAAKQLLVSQGYLHAFHWMVHALVSLKIVKNTVLADLFGSAAELARWWEYTESDISPHWLAWVQAYISQTNRGDEGY